MDVSISKAIDVGNVHLSNMTLQFVLHVPNIWCNLILVSKLTKDLHCALTAFLIPVNFHDLTSML